MSDETSITFKNFELTVSAVVHVADPPGTFMTHPDGPVSLADALLNGLKACGLENRLDELYDAIRAAVEPGFKATIKDFEEIRRRAVTDDGG